VFPEEELRELIPELITATNSGKGTVVKKTHRVIANPWWGIVGGWQVEICWVYLQMPQNWFQNLPSDTKDAITKNDAVLKNFPNYATADNNGHLSLTRLTNSQVTLLADMTDWVVRTNANLVRSTLS